MSLFKFTVAAGVCTFLAFLSAHPQGGAEKKCLAHHVFHRVTGDALRVVRLQQGDVPDLKRGELLDLTLNCSVSEEPDSGIPNDVYLLRGPDAASVDLLLIKYPGDGGCYERRRWHTDGRFDEKPLLSVPGLKRNQVSLMPPPVSTTAGCPKN